MELEERILSSPLAAVIQEEGSVGDIQIRITRIPDGQKEFIQVLVYDLGNKRGKDSESNIPDNVFFLGEGLIGAIYFNKKRIPNTPYAIGVTPTEVYQWNEPFNPFDGIPEPSQRYRTTKGWEKVNSPKPKK